MSYTHLNKDDKQQELKRQTQLHSEPIKITAAQTAIWIAAPTTLGRVVSSVRSSSGYHGLIEIQQQQQATFPNFQIWSNPA